MNKNVKQVILSITALSFAILITNCNSSTKENNTQTIKPTLDQSELNLGFKLLETNCFSCHGPNASGDNVIAPLIGVIKKQYVTERTSQEEFVKELTQFVQNPTEKGTKMPDAIKRFGLMPKMDFSDKQLKAIAIYIYYTELEKPNWFKEDYLEERKKHMQNSSNEGLSYSELGLQYAMATKSVLGKNLLNALSTKGTENALSFCSSKAYPLTDSMATSLNVYIKRVSDKNRNPKNAANPDELQYISKWKELISSGEKIKPRINEVNGKIVGYYPIMTNIMCLQCHGKPDKDILPNTLTKIGSLYPEDKAIGYGVDELRGIWVVEMDKKRD